MKEIMEFADSIGNLLFDHSPLSLELVREKIISFSRKNGFVEDPIFLQIVGLYSGYRGKTRTAEIFFKWALKNAGMDLKEAVLFNMAIFYLNIKEINKAIKTIKRLEKITDNPNRLIALQLELEVARGNINAATQMTTKAPNKTEELIRCVLLAGFFYKWEYKEFSRIIFHTRLSELIRGEVRKGEKSFKQAYTRSMKLLEFVAKRVSPLSHRAFNDYKNSEFSLDREETKILNLSSYQDRINKEQE